MSGYVWPHYNFISEEKARIEIDALYVHYSSAQAEQDIKETYKLLVKGLTLEENIEGEYYNTYRLAIFLVREAPETCIILFTKLLENKHVQSDIVTLQSIHYYLGKIYSSSKNVYNLLKAIDHLKKAPADPDALYKLGKFALLGQLNSTPDKLEALEYFRKAIMCGSQKKGLPLLCTNLLAELKKSEEELKKQKDRDDLIVSLALQVEQQRQCIKQLEDEQHQQHIEHN